MKENIIFILPTLTQPRFHKRIDFFNEHGYSVKIYSFDRGLYKSNTISKKYNTTVLGKVVDGKYLNRIKIYYKSFKRIKKENYNGNATVYIFGLDLGFFSKIYLSRFKIIYEVGDIPYLNSNMVISKIYTTIDKLLLKKIDLLVLTSHGFFNFHYKKFINPNKVVFIPNKLSKYFINSSRPEPKKIEKKIKFGFVGLLRYERTLLPFIHSIGNRAENYEMHIYGDGPLKQKIEKISKSYDNIFYHGEFKSPYDLSRIYSTFDINYVCYDTKGINERIAEPNKLFESIFFLKPIIVSQNTFIGEKTLKAGTGYVLDASSKVEIEKFLDMLEIKEIEKIQKNCKDISTESLISDQFPLLDKINNEKFRTKE